MTDAFIVDERGQFVVGKAQTTPQDESVGFADSVDDALRYWGLRAESLAGIASSVYSGTAMLNRLLERKGQRLGVIVSAGFEDYLELERGLQTYLGYSYSDRLHTVTHRHNPPLVDRDRVLGVRGRIDLFGEEQIPLAEAEVRNAVEILLLADVEVICVSLIYSYVNPMHERRVEQIAQEVMGDRQMNRPVFLSSALYPVSGDFARLNTLIAEAYAAEPSRGQMQRIQGRLRSFGCECELRVMASHGGTISTDTPELARTLVSGPIGGVVGAKYLAERLGYPNVVCSDIGGTSFDLALITEGEVSIKTQIDLARKVLSLPAVQIDSVGSGTGSFVRLAPWSERLEIGPDSAGHRIGVSNAMSGLDTPTITDCDLVLGYLNPAYFLGGDIALDVERARVAIAEQIGEPLGLSVEEAAEGVIALFQENLRNEMNSRVLGKGFAPENFRILSYGGGGPVHVAGYTRGLDFLDVLVPAWAAGFSAFGCACADYEYRGDQSVSLPLHTGVEEEPMWAELNSAWERLSARVLNEFSRSGVDPSRVKLRSILRMQYQGQLNDVEVALPVDRVTDVADVQDAVERFERAYAAMYSLSAKSPELGYEVTRVVIAGEVAVEKPVLPAEPTLEDADPSSVQQGTRSVYFAGEWLDTRIFRMEQLRPGHQVDGPAIIESPATTLVLPSGCVAGLDQHRIFHLSRP